MTKYPCSVEGCSNLAGGGQQFCWSCLCVILTNKTKCLTRDCPNMINTADAGRFYCEPCRKLHRAPSPGMAGPPQASPTARARVSFRERVGDVTRYHIRRRGMPTIAEGGAIQWGGKKK